MNKFFKFKNSCGFSLVEVSIAMALVSIVALAVFELSGLNSKDSRFMSLSRLAVEHRNRIVANIKNPVSWQNTSSNNLSFNCFAVGSSCILNQAAGSLGYYNFVLYGPNDNEKLTYDPTDPTSRISLSSSRCAVDVSNPHSNCPLKYQAQWKPISNEQIEIKIDLIYDFPEELPFNTGKYSIRIIRDFRDSSIRAACQALNGSIDLATGSCIPKHANRGCGGIVNQVVTAINSDGTVICKPLYKGQCSSINELVSGISTSGQVICADRPSCTP